MDESERHQDAAMRKGAIALVLAVSVVLIAAAGVFNMMARTSGIEALLDAADLARRIHDLTSAPEAPGMNAGAVARLVVEFADRAAAVPDMPAAAAGDIALLVEEARLGEAADGAGGLHASRVTAALEGEYARRLVFVQNCENATVASLGLLALFWILLGVRRRPQTAEPPGSGVPEDPAVREGDLLLRGVAAALAVRAERIAELANALRDSRLRLGTALEDTGLDRSLHDGARLGEEVEAMEPVLDALRRASGDLSSLGIRLESMARETGAGAGRVDVAACLDEALEILGAPGAVRVAVPRGDLPRVHGVRLDIVLALARIIVRALDAAGESAVEVATTAAGGRVEVAVTPPGGGARGVVCDPALVLASALVERHGGAVTIAPDAVRVSFPALAARED